MEEVVDATGAGGRKVRAVPSAATDKDKEYQQQPLSSFSRSAGSVSLQVNKVNKNSIPKRAMPTQTGLLSPDEDVLQFGVTSSGQSNHSSCSDRVSGQIGLESGIGVKEQPDWGKVCPADSWSWHMPRASSGEVFSGSLKGESELIGKFQKTPRRRRSQVANCKGGNMVMLRGRGLVRAVRGELEKAAGSAQASQASMQVILDFSTLTQAQEHQNTYVLSCSARK